VGVLPLGNMPAGGMALAGAACYHRTGYVRGVLPPRERRQSSGMCNISAPPPPHDTKDRFRTMLFNLMVRITRRGIYHAKEVFAASMRLHFLAEAFVSLGGVIAIEVTGYPTEPNIFRKKF